MIRIGLVRIILILICLLSFASETMSQIQREWVSRFNGTGNSFDIVSGMLELSDGGVLVYGSTVGIGTLTDFALINYDRSGNTRWVSTYDGPASQSDQLSAAVIDSAGNIYAAGFVSANNSFFPSVSKFSSTGQLIWIRTAEVQGYRSGMARSVIVTASGNILTGGFMTDSSGVLKMYLRLYSQSGSVLNSRIFAGTALTADLHIKQGAEEIVYLLNKKIGAFGGTDISIEGIDSDLNSVWQVNISGNIPASDDEPTDIVTDAQGNVLVCATLINSDTGPDVAVMKLTPGGQILWMYNLNRYFTQKPSGITLDKSGNAYVTGFTIDNFEPGTSRDIITVKLNSAGSEMWSRVYKAEADGDDGGNSVAVDTIGNVYVGGYSDRGNVEATYAFLKYDLNGNLLYFDRYSTATVPEDFIYSVIVNRFSEVFVTGISIDDQTDYDFATIKYSSILGVLSGSSQTIPDVFSLSQNYPNPFNPSTKINFDIPSGGFVSLKIFDTSGREVASLVNEVMTAGHYAVDFNASNLSSGTYYYRLSLNSDRNIFTEAKKMLLVK